MRIDIGGAAVETAVGDITRETTEVIVNAANEGLRGGGGVDGAIHRAAGPSLMAECRRIGRCPTGSVVATGAGLLAARRVYHTVGPIWRGGGAGEPELLASCYRAALVLAAAEGMTSLAFPAVSTGVYGYPARLAARAAVATVLEELRAHPGPVKLVRFILFDAAMGALYDAALAELSQGNA